MDEEDRERKRKKKREVPLGHFISFDVIRSFSEQPVQLIELLSYFVLLLFNVPDPKINFLFFLFRRCFRQLFFFTSFDSLRLLNIAICHAWAEEYAFILFFLYVLDVALGQI